MALQGLYSRCLLHSPVFGFMGYARQIFLQRGSKKSGWKFLKLVKRY
jgi:hypothetical protein